MNFKEICKVVNSMNKYFTEDCLCVQIFQDGSGSLTDTTTDHDYFVFVSEEDFCIKALGLLERSDLKPEARLLAIVNKE